MKSNEQEGIKVNQPKTYEDRVKVAGECMKDLELTIPCLVDDMKNTAQLGYAGWPDRMYVVDKEGKVSYKGDLGPRGFKPSDAEEALKKLLK
jgi:type I thyroxine 5'-deiodinase